MLRIELSHISKSFDSEQVIGNLTYSFEQPGSYALLGSNGSGKSTLLQIISGFVSVDEGSIKYILNGRELDRGSLYALVSVCAPYAELIEEMTLTEFLSYHFSFKPCMVPLSDLLSLVGLQHASDKLLSVCSSGMKQRIKLLCALVADTPMVLLDEPCTNLDHEGIALYLRLIELFASSKLCIVASNDAAEYSFCKHHLRVRELSALNK